VNAAEQNNTTAEIEQILRAEHSDPFHVLGPHVAEIGGKRQLVVRTFQPRAEAVSLVPAGGAPVEMARVHAEGVFEAVLPPVDGAKAEKKATASYQLAIRYHGGATATVEDPYRFPPLLSEFDLHLLGEGTHY